MGRRRNIKKKLVTSKTTRKKEFTRVYKTLNKKKNTLPLILSVLFIILFNKIK